MSRFDLLLLGIRRLILILAELLDSTKTSSAPGTDQTNLATGGCLLAHGRGTTNVLVVTTTEGMLHGVLRHTTNLGPAVALDGVLVVGAPGLQERLVRASSAGDDANLGADLGGDGLLPAGGETEAGGALVLVVGDDHGEAPGSAGEGAAVADLGLDVAHDGALGDLLQGEDVADAQRGLLAAVDELAGVHALRGDHELRVALEAVGVEELDLGDGRAPPGVVQDLLHHAADVPPALGVVDGAELHGPLARAGVRLEDGGLSLSLRLESTSCRWAGCEGTHVEETIDSFHESEVMHYPLTIRGSAMASHRGFEQPVGWRNTEVAKGTTSKGNHIFTVGSRKMGTMASVGEEATEGRKTVRLRFCDSTTALNQPRIVCHRSTTQCALPSFDFAFGVVLPGRIFPWLLLGCEK